MGSTYDLRMKVVVFLHAAPGIQLLVNVDVGWLKISCHFLDCKVLLDTSCVSSTIASTRTFTLLVK